MTHIASTIRIDAPKAEVWNVLADFGGVVKFHTGLRDSRSTSDATGGVGATRHCDLHPMGSVEERVVAWDEGREMTIEIYDSERVPVKTGLATLRVSEDSGDMVAEMILEYETKGGLVGTVVDRMMMRGQFEKTVSNILRGLKVYAETGRRASRAQLRELRLAGAAA